MAAAHGNARDQRNVSYHAMQAYKELVGRRTGALYAGGIEAGKQASLALQPLLTRTLS